MYYRGAAAAIIVYDITNQASFDRAKKWVKELQAQGNPNMVMALAGNKSDMLDGRTDAQTYAQENGLFFLETSAKTAANVNEVFYEIGKRFITLLPCNQAPVQRDYHGCSRHQTHRAWSSWIDQRKGQTVLPVVLENSTVSSLCYVHTSESLLLCTLHICTYDFSFIYAFPI
ncbi:hypothetical protein SASPL_144471 [Salvia splendens]|uniref:Ras-related protein Rab-5A n=1 Tax=Salvia splendens TaxID=180675 RepID=A0A8X8Z6T4_SALSN|nr:hypothetical protein SASPL_144471 [Salvia splendens]